METAAVKHLKVDLILHLENKAKLHWIKVQVNKDHLQTNQELLSQDVILDREVNIPSITTSQICSWKTIPIPTSILLSNRISLKKLLLEKGTATVIWVIWRWTLWRLLDKETTERKNIYRDIMSRIGIMNLRNLVWER